MTACGYSIKKYNFWHLSIAIGQKFCFYCTEQKGLVTNECIIEKRERIELLPVLIGADRPSGWQQKLDSDRSCELNTSRSLDPIFPGLCEKKTFSAL